MHLDRQRIALEGPLHRLLQPALVAALGQVDEVDEDRPAQVAQADLTGDLGCSVEIGLERRPAAAIHVYRNACGRRLDPEPPAFASGTSAASACSTCSSTSALAKAG